MAPDEPQEPPEGRVDDGDVEVPPAPRVAYEIVYDCPDKMLGARLAQRLEDVLDPTSDVRRTEEGPSWAVTIGFASRGSADRFFDSDAYRQFCIEARRSCRSAVLVVPLGEVAD